MAISLKKDGVKPSAYTKGLEKLSGAEQRTTKEKLEALVAANPVESATPGKTLKVHGKEMGLIWTQCIIGVIACLLASTYFILHFELPNNIRIFPLLLTTSTAAAPDAPAQQGIQKGESMLHNPLVTSLSSVPAAAPAAAAADNNDDDSAPPRRLVKKPSVAAASKGGAASPSSPPAAGQSFRASPPATATGPPKVLACMRLFPALSSWP